MVACKLNTQPAVLVGTLPALSTRPPISSYSSHAPAKNHSQKWNLEILNYWVAVKELSLNGHNGDI